MAITNSVDDMQAALILYGANHSTPATGNWNKFGDEFRFWSVSQGLAAIPQGISGTGNRDAAMVTAATALGLAALPALSATVGYHQREAAFWASWRALPPVAAP